MLKFRRELLAKDKRKIKKLIEKVKECAGEVYEGQRQF